MRSSEIQDSRGSRTYGNLDQYWSQNLRSTNLLTEVYDFDAGSFTVSEDASVS